MTTPRDALAALRESVEHMSGFGGWAISRKAVLLAIDEAVAALASQGYAVTRSEAGPIIVSVPDFGQQVSTSGAPFRRSAALARADCETRLAALRTAASDVDVAISELVADGWSSLSVKRAVRAQDALRAALAADPDEV